jgi:UDP-N-acetylglucosamine 2-epimerase (non-hydrolysing)
MRKVMTIVGTRPELIKMARVIALFDEHTEHCLVHTGQNFDYELNQIFFDDLGIRKPDHFLNATAETTAGTIARIIERSDGVFDAVKPDALLLYGDTNSCLCVIPAKRRKIPVFHMEAGNRCFDQRVPEELNRKVVDHLSDVNIALTEHARRYLLAEGLPADRVFVSGSHMDEVLNYYLPRIRSSDILARLGLSSQKYFVVSAHREENVDSPERLKTLVAALESLCSKYEFPIIVSTHPRTRKRLHESGLQTNNDRIIFSKPFGFFDYIALQMNAACVLSDSGTITEESSLLNFPAVTLRDAHERPEGMDAGTLIMCGLETESILDAIEATIATRQSTELKCSVVENYRGGAVSRKILNIVLSYIDYIQRVVWSARRDPPCSFI